MNLNSVKQTIAVVLALACLTAGTVFAQKKSYVFHGKVEAVNAASNSITVKNEKIEGWMDAMSMAYKTDKPESLKNVKVGDNITATVYDGDHVLHNIQVVPPGKK